MAGNFVFLPAKEFEMKNIIVPIFLLFMAFACQPRLSMQPLLEKADSLLVSNPDSVFLMLDAVPNPEDFPENEYADWCLLLTQARDMTGRTHTSDSLICLATNYYREHGPSLKYATALYASARVASDLGWPDRAVQYYLEAEHFGEETNNYRLLYLITSNLAQIYGHLQLEDSTMNVYKRAVKYARLSKDRLVVAKAECSLGQAYSLEEKWDTSIYYYERAIKILLGTDSLNTISEILNECVSDAISLKDWDLAKEYLRLQQTVPFAYRREHQSQIDLNKGRYYQGIGNINLSKEYVSKSVLSENPYIRRDSYYLLYQLERQSRNYDNAFAYLDSYKACKDSIEMHSEKETITRLPELYKNKLLQEQNADLQFKHYFYVALSTSIILFLFCLYLIYRNRFQKQIASLRCAMSSIKKLNREIAEWKKKYRLEKIFKTKAEVNKAVLLIQLKETPAPIEKEQWSELFLTIDILFDNFTQRLKDAYPDLTPIDSQYCCLFKAGFSIQQIAVMQMVDSKSVSRRKIEIRKRMHLDGKADVVKVCKEL